jgi:hypothetical protein
VALDTETPRFFASYVTPSNRGLTNQAKVFNFNTEGTQDIAGVAEGYCSPSEDYHSNIAPASPFFSRSMRKPTDDDGSTYRKHMTLYNPKHAVSSVSRSFTRHRTERLNRSISHQIYDEEYWRHKASQLIQDKKLNLKENYDLR